MRFSFSKKKLVLAIALSLPVMGIAADNQPDSSTMAGTYKGYDLPGQYLVKETTKIADNMMPVVVNPLQNDEAQQKLAALEKKEGKYTKKN